jgi:hypothetical protein
MADLGIRPHLDPIDSVQRHDSQHDWDARGGAVRNRSPVVVMLVAFAAFCGVAMSTAAGIAHADAVAYLVNVTVRPGYHFANADDALTYGRGICAEVAQNRPYADVMAGVKSDFDNPDEFQASYLITQAVNELCPSMIWGLRNSAANYRSPTT